MSRAVLIDTPHHLTQRGVGGFDVFGAAEDREVYLKQIASCAERFGVELLGYCLMSNHVHWVVTPREPDSLARAFGEAHGRYASYANAKLCRSGHFWQNRFFSCALDRPHLFAALRYVERNPVRAGLVARAEEYPWSSARAHIGSCTAPPWLAGEILRSTFTPDQWAIYLAAASFSEAEMEVRRRTYTGRPAGSDSFVAHAEGLLGRTLAPQRGGRPAKITPKSESDPRQQALFGAA